MSGSTIEAEQDGRLCYVELLGPLRINRADQAVTQFARQKAAGLLAYLALRPGPHPRERLIDLFWPELDLPAGRNNLSTTLVSLRRQIESAGVRRGSVLVTTHAEVGLNPEALTTDVAIFEGLLKRAARTDEPAKRVALLQRAVALYRGDLLPGHYQDWAVREMERLQARYQEGLQELAGDLERLGDLSGALELSRRICVRDPYSEEEHCRLIRLLVQTGSRTLAKEAHRRFERLFAEEFGTSPSAEAQRMVWHLLSQPPAVRPQEPDDPILPASAPPAMLKREQPATPEDVPSYLTVLPVVLTRFFGREAELEQLAELLLPRKTTPIGSDGSELPCRLVTLVGPSGIGKTRLVLEFARQAATQLAAWCGFLSLADLTEARRIETALAQVLKLAPDPATPPLERVIAQLRQHDRPGMPTLLILDNLEHLLKSDALEAVTDCPVAGLVQTLLERVPCLTLLCTSRRRLGVRGEHLVPIDALPVPEIPTGAVDAEDLSGLLAMPSVRLYVDRAQAVRPDFGLTAANAPAVAALCRQLEGSPLALELAAAWVRALPPRKMWERLTQGLEIPAGSYADLPARHRTLSAALDWSFRLLTAAQQRLFVQLSIFQGGWTAEAVEAVCEESEALLLLGQLQEASLVSVTEETEGEIRYRFLETVRAYSRHRLQEPREYAALQSRHAAYFLALAEEAAPYLRGAEQALWLARLDREHENLRAVFDWSRQNESGGPVGMKLAAALGSFWEIRAHYTEGRERLAGLLTDRPEPTLESARALNVAGMLAWYQSDYTVARKYHVEALTIFQQIDDQEGIAETFRRLGDVNYAQGDYASAYTFQEQGLALRRTMNDSLGIADSLISLGNSGK